ncbi:uncharacterized protein LOC131950040 [Physella acuta]|uniref:uncharacterized protein LOC131950040 n=1 Tax=Physella acuta TaxID=109671 RepID=UPI0027DD213D|nr:uncharacterized protein LOC131950040 [Physella acuta]
MDFYCMNPDTTNKNMSSRMLRTNNFDTSLIKQFLHIRFNTPAGTYVACGHKFSVDAIAMTVDLDNTHTIYLDMWSLNHRPSITFTPIQGEVYTLVAYDAGYLSLGGIWVNIKTADTSSGTEIYPYNGPVNPLYEKHNSFVFALFKQKNGDITDIAAQKSQVLKTVVDNDGIYYLDSFISSNNLEGPVGIGFIAVAADAFGIQYFIDRNIFNNCPYLVSSNKGLQTALRSMGYQLDGNNSFTDYRGTFLLGLQVDLQVTYYSPEAHFDSCCTHSMQSMVEVRVDPLATTTLMPLHVRNQPFIQLLPIEMRMPTPVTGQLYTLLLLDVTEAKANISNPNTVIHWQVVNIPGDDIPSGDTIRGYLSPLPAIKKDVRTMMFLLLSQPSRVDPGALWSYTGTGCDSRTTLRCKFNLGAFMKNLNFKLVGLTMFLTEQDAFTRAVLYGSVNLNDIATSDTTNTISLISMDTACNGVSGYANPCPDACSSTNPGVTNPVAGTTVTPTTTTMMMHDHGM